jgi:hypothetical protein
MMVPKWTPRSYARDRARPLVFERCGERHGTARRQDDGRGRRRVGRACAHRTRADREGDATVVEQALNAFLLGRLLEEVQSTSDLSEREADRLAYEELRAARRDRAPSSGTDVERPGGG